MKKEIIRVMRMMVSSIDIELSSKIMYRVFVHKKLNIENPVTFNEKLNWLKLRVFPYDPVVVKCADKYLVHNYIQKKGYKDLLVKLYGVWDNVEEINWNNIPDKFVLKCNHGCAYNIICENKSKFDRKSAYKKLKKWMKTDFGLVSGEPHYSKIPRKIICEEFLEGEINEYKFFCFNGIPKFYYVSKTTGGDFHNNLLCDFVLPNGEPADFYRLDHKRFEVIPDTPKNLDKMFAIAKDLSSEFPFVRVDFMNVKGKLYFSELTFTPSAGIMPLAPKEIDEKLGTMLNIKNIK